MQSVEIADKPATRSCSTGFRRSAGAGFGDPEDFHGHGLGHGQSHGPSASGFLLAGPGHHGRPGHRGHHGHHGRGLG